MNFQRVFVPLLAAALLFAAHGLFSAPATTAQQKTSDHSQKRARFHYVCPMHEDVTSKRPGKKCYKCKMKLEKRRVKEPTETPSQ